MQRYSFSLNKDEKTFSPSLFPHQTTRQPHSNRPTPPPPVFSPKQLPTTRTQAAPQSLTSPRSVKATAAMTTLSKILFNSSHRRTGMVASCFDYLSSPRADMGQATPRHSPDEAVRQYLLSIYFLFLLRFVSESETKRNRNTEKAMPKLNTSICLAASVCRGLPLGCPAAASVTIGRLLTTDRIRNRQK